MTKTKYDLIEKDRLTKKLLPPENYSLTKLSDETGISKSTLSTWKGKALKGEFVKDRRTLTQQAKFLIVMETYTLSEIELSKYCRKNGYYFEDIKKWKINCIEGNSSKAYDIEEAKRIKKELIEEKNNIKILKKDLRRKEKALAETTALLVLKKKLNVIFGEIEED